MLEQQKEKDYYKSERVSNFYNSNFSEYESNGYRNITRRIS